MKGGISKTQAARLRAIKDDYIIYSENDNLDALLAMQEYFVIGLDPAIHNFAVGIEQRKQDEDPKYVTLFKFGASKDKEKHNSTMLNFNFVMDDYKDWWPHINLIVIERQIPGKKSYQLYQHAISYFLFNCPSAIVLDVSPKLKGRILDAPPNLNYTGLKKWSVKTGKQLLEERNDNFALGKLIGRKQDDMCDVVCEIEALLKYLQINSQNNFR